ncbi:hypothetical protein F2P81_005118 [Scophthalmus maximus]|uniref:Uncharacterized protein n=1 Tax=Scophthalmus maximus TaxID=52904 RepID=A0A6A4T2A4_SCOMX|nr:hypothetical protein F2P81_005118 [Scophthalmus maximus]
MKDKKKKWLLLSSPVQVPEDGSTGERRLTGGLAERPNTDSPRPSDSDMELRFRQCRQYLDLNERLQEARGRLLRQREELRSAGEQLDRDVLEAKGQAL